jgi:hypothetical protein
MVKWIRKKTAFFGVAWQFLFSNYSIFNKNSSLNWNVCEVEKAYNGNCLVLSSLP